MDAAQQKFEVTKGKFEIEKAAKDSRDLEEAAAKAEKEFNERAAKRKSDLADLKKTRDDTAAAFKKNGEDITKWSDILKSDPNNANAKTELDKAEGETANLKKAAEDAEKAFAPILLS